ncbi:MAG: hypothetical protein ACW967_08335, partial [Candidatus Hodarchaeales archaeon]
MSSDKEFSFSRPLTIFEIFSRSVQYYFANLYILVFFLIAFFLFLGYIFSITSLGYPSSINIDFESILNTIDLSNPNINANELFAIYRDLLFVLVGERVVIGILLSIPYALTVTIIDTSIKNNFTTNLPIDSNFQGIPKKFSAFDKIKLSFEKMRPKLFIILTIAFIINLLIAIGNMLFYLPGILVSVFFALAPVVIILEPQLSFGSIFSRSRDLIKGFF